MRDWWGIRSGAGLVGVTVVTVVLVSEQVTVGVHVMWCFRGHILG